MQARLLRLSQNEWVHEGLGAVLTFGGLFTGVGPIAAIGLVILAYEVIKPIK